MAVLLGLIGYGWRIRLAGPPIWAVVFGLYVLSTVALIPHWTQGLRTIRTDPAFADSGDFGTQMTRLAVMIAVYSVLKAFALFRYAFRERSLWYPTESN
jgi:hypothetical protein